MLVRLAVEADRCRLAEMGKCNMAEATPGDVWDDEKANVWFDAYLNRANPTVFVLEENRQIIGYIAGSTAEKQFSTGFIAYIDVIYVMPEKRRSRAAAHLITAFNQWVARLQPDEVVVYAANAGVSPLLPKYLQRFGYRQTGVILQL
jgi:ribosomal protein S18 acetylase RimI-like enzyme